MTRPTVSISDVQSRSEQDLSTLDVIYLMTLIGDAQDLIDAEAPAAQVRLDAGTLTANLYKRVVADVVLRVVRNPDGFNAEAAGDANVSRNQLVASGDLWLSDRDVARLTGAGPTVGTIHTRPARLGCGPARW